MNAQIVPKNSLKIHYHCGILIISQDPSGKIIGVPDILSVEERLANAISDSIRPALIPKIEIISNDGKPLLIVRVPHWRGPFYLKTDGPENGVYIRLGSTNRQAGPEILAELHRSLSGMSFDLSPFPDMSIDDLDLSKARHFFATIGLELDLIKMESLGILVPFAGRLVPTLGGIILFGHESARLRRCQDARISCARFRGTSKAEFLDSLDIEGTVLDAVSEVPRFIRRNTRTAAKIEGMYRLEIPEYPDVAVCEALVNAVAHSAYFLSGMRIMVAIYDDRLEIQNPGMLPFGMTLDDLKAGVSKSRNRMIARVMRTLAMMEEWGSGYKRIMEACRAGGYPEPEWQEFGSAIRVVFKPHSEVFLVAEPHVPVNERQAWILEQLAAGQKLRVYP